MQAINPLFSIWKCFYYILWLHFFFGHPEVVSRLAQFAKRESNTQGHQPFYTQHFRGDVMQSPSFVRMDEIATLDIDSEFDAEAMLEQLASQKETAARAPFMAPAFLKEQMSRMDNMRACGSALQEVEFAETNRFRVAHDTQEMTGAMPVFRKIANVSRPRIDAVDVLRRSPLECPKERFKGLPEKRSDIREVIDYASLSDLLEEIQFKKLGIAYFDEEIVDEDDLACRFSTDLPKIARTATQTLAETFSGCCAVIKLLFFGASLGFTDYSNI
jgi:hypothetical protein